MFSPNRVFKGGKKRRVTVKVVRWAKIFLDTVCPCGLALVERWRRLVETRALCESGRREEKEARYRPRDLIKVARRQMAH
ncbi:MAG: hypothetical protein ACR2MG_17295 [Pyrinomonadaceae bacterium]